MIKTQIINPDLKRQIEIFYKVSLFVSKFGLVLLAFILSIVITFSSLSNFKGNILNYSSNILLVSANIDNLTQDFIGVQDPDLLSKKLNYLKADYVLSKSLIDKTKVKLGWGLYFIPGGMQFPSFLSLNKKYLKYLSGDNLRKVLDSYYAIIHRASYYSPNIKIKLLDDKGLSDMEMKKRYNLNCINSNLSNKTLFCKANKAILIQDLINGKVEISKSAYDTLFKSLDLTNFQKCGLIKKIYSSKLNYENIIDIAKKYCEDVEDFNIVKDIVTNFGKGLFISSDLLTVEGKYHKLVNQWIYLLKSDSLSVDNIVFHIDYVRNLMDNDLLSEGYLYIEYKVLNYLKVRVIGDDNLVDVMPKIDKLINGDKIAFQKGIKSYLKGLIDNEQEKSNIMKPTKRFMVKSVRERFLELIRKDYKKYFVPTQKVSFKDNIAYLYGNLLLLIGEEKRKKIYKLPVYLVVNLNSLIGSKFTVKEIKILDNKAKNYLNAKGVSIPQEKDLVYLQSYFSNALADYYLNKGKKIFISFCDKAKKKGFENCANNTITLREKKGMLSVKFVFEDEVLSKIILPPYVRYEISEDWAGKEEFKMNLEKLSKKLNKMIKNKNYGLEDVKKIYSLISKFINRKKDEYIQKLVGLPSEDVIKIQALFKQYLGVNISKIRHIEGTKYYIYFSVSGYNVRVIYDYSSNKIINIEVFNKKDKTFIDFGPVNLVVGDLNLEDLNLFAQETETFLKGLNEEAYQKLEESKKEN